jgi:hypothetical protein
MGKRLVLGSCNPLSARPPKARRRISLIIIIIIIM